MQGQYGTYKVTGNTVVRNVVSAANPNIEGIESKSQFRDCARVHKAAFLNAAKNYDGLQRNVDSVQVER